MTYTVASEGHGRLQSRGLRFSLRTAPSAEYVPAGLVHAARDDDGSTACGIAVVNLWNFPGLVFGEQRPALLCPLCLERAR